MVYAHVSGSLSARSMSLLPSTVAPGTSWAIALSGAAVSAHAINTPGVRHEWLLEARSGRDIHRTSSGFDSGAVESTGDSRIPLRGFQTQMLEAIAGTGAPQGLLSWCCHTC